MSELNIKTQKGVVLPVALIIIFIMTSLVFSQIKRSIVDQRLAVNSAEYMSQDTSAQTFLRWCEAWVTQGGANSREDITAVLPSGANASWRDDANWNIGSGFVRTIDTELSGQFPGIQSVQCLYENATSELRFINQAVDSSYEVEGRGAAGADPAMRKYRITVRVLLKDNDTDNTNNPRLHYQSELRFRTS